IYCAYLILKPIIIKLIKNKCVYTLSYLIVSLCITMITLLTIVLSESLVTDYNQRMAIVGSLWLSIIIMGCIFFITFIGKILSHYIRNKNIST
ncbi:hypothetical protein, partial [Piscibacillus halophilus]